MCWSTCGCGVVVVGVRVSRSQKEGAAGREPNGSSAKNMSLAPKTIALPEYTDNDGLC